VTAAASESSASQTTTSAPTRCRSSQAALTFLHATAGRSKRSGRPKRPSSNANRNPSKPYSPAAPWNGSPSRRNQANQGAPLRCRSPSRVASDSTRQQSSPPRGRGFESCFLQRRVGCEPDFLHDSAGPRWPRTAERGGGLVCWLESLRALIAAPPACEVIFTANSGHELGHLGLDDFMAHRPGWERPISEGAPPGYISAPALVPPTASKLPVQDVTKAKPRVPWARLTLRILPVTITYFCYGWSFWLFITWLPSFFKDHYNLDLKNAALFSSAVFFAGVVGDTSGGMISDAILRRTGDPQSARRNVTVGAMVGAGICLGLVFTTANLTLDALFLASGFFCLELVIGPIWPIPMDIAPEYAGTGSGLMNTGSAVAAIVSPLAFGLIVHRLGGGGTKARACARPNDARSFGDDGSEMGASVYHLRESGRRGLVPAFLRG
jgi:Major Facilitator Superfamily